MGVKETEFVLQVLPEIAGHGDRVFFEVETLHGRIDMVLQHPSGERTAYEFKLRGAGECIAQADRNRQWADRSVAVVHRPAATGTRRVARKTAQACGVGLIWVWPEGHLDVAVDPISQRPPEGNVVAMTEQLKEAELLGQEGGSTSPRSLTEHEQIVIEAEQLVRDQGGALMPREIGMQLACRFGRTSKEVRRIVTRRIGEGKGRSLSLERRGGVNVVVIDPDLP